MRVHIWSFIAALSMLLVSSEISAQTVASSQRALRSGFVLPLHSKDPNYRYDWMVQQIGDFGATDISFVVKLFQEHATSEFPSRHATQTSSDETLRSAIRTAVRLKMRVMVVPIVLLERPKTAEWRGVLEPPDRREWFRGYTEEILRFVRLAEDSGATSFAIGSELSSLEPETERWLSVLSDVRKEFTGQLTYSANWDHWEHVKFWDRLDFMGISAYFQLARHPNPTEAELVDSWGRIKQRLIDRRKLLGVRVPLVFTELGYPSQDGCASKPWDYYSTANVDLAEQELCFRAFINTWKNSPDLSGVYVYDWWGKGGIDDRSYTPQGKPSAKVISEWFTDRRAKRVKVLPGKQK